MKNSKIKLLSVAACLALVGTASAAWAYAGTASQSASIGVKVAAYADAGSITVSGADNLRVYLDNGSVTFIKEDKAIPFTATYTKPNGFEDKTVTLTYQVVISSYLANFVTYSDGVTSSKQSDNTIATGYDYTWTSGNEISLDTLPKLAWKDGTENGSVYAQEASYYTMIGQITGTAVGADFDKTKVWDASSNINAYNVKINFKAEVANS